MNLPISRVEALRLVLEAIKGGNLAVFLTDAVVVVLVLFRNLDTAGNGARHGLQAASDPRNCPYYH